jgi:hypothetical protein
MNPFGNAYPPGVGQSDIGDDDYYCSKCERQIDESDIDDDVSEGFEHICKDCALVMRAEHEEEEQNQERIMEIIWRVQDGYQNHGTHQLEIPEERLRKAATPEAAMGIIEDAIHADFEQVCKPELHSRPTVESAVGNLFAKPEVAPVEPEPVAHAAKKKDDSACGETTKGYGSATHHETHGHTHAAHGEKGKKGEKD